MRASTIACILLCSLAAPIARAQTGPAETVKKGGKLTSASAASSEPQQPVVATSTSRAADATPPPPATRFVAWGALAAAGAFLGSAVVAEIIRQQNVTHYNDDGLCMRPELGTRDEQCGAYRGRAETAQTFEKIGFVAAGTLGIASVVLFVVEPSRAARTSGLRVDPLPGGLGVGWTGTF